MLSLSQLLANRDLRLIDLAKALKVNRATVTRWNQKGVPADRVEDVAKAANIPACDIRPDLARLFVKSKGMAQ